MRNRESDSDSPNFGRKEKCRNVIMSKSNKVENKNGTNVEMLDAYKRQHMIVRNFNALTLTRTFSPSLLFLFSTFLLSTKVGITATVIAVIISSFCSQLRNKRI